MDDLLAIFPAVGGPLGASGGEWGPRGLWHTPEILFIVCRGGLAATTRRRPQTTDPEYQQVRKALHL